VLTFESAGYSDALCTISSSFESDYSECQNCLSINSNGSQLAQSLIPYIKARFSLALDWCIAQPAVVVSSSAAAKLVSTDSRSSSVTTTIATSYQTSASTSSSITSASTYNYGFWLDYTFILCPSRISTAPATPQATGNNSLWGCSPGYVCTPPQVDCDLEAGLPSADYQCDAQYCVPARPLPPEPVQLLVDGTSTLYSPLLLPTGLFNLDPALFGLDWGIFTGIVSVTSTLGSPASTTSSNATISEYPLVLKMPHRKQQLRFTASTQTPTTAPAHTPLPIPNPKSKTWIAGPVVGFIAGITFIVLAVLYNHQHRRRHRMSPALSPETQEKAQLDGEGIKPKEVDDNQIRELEGNQIEPAEMDGGFIPAEMGKSRERINRKPVPSSDT